MTTSAKLILLSILLMSILIPARAAAAKDPRKGLKRALIQMALFDLVYVLSVTYVFPRFL
jgi:hypothetical protein